MEIRLYFEIKETKTIFKYLREMWSYQFLRKEEHHDFHLDTEELYSRFKTWKTFSSGFQV